MAGIRTCVQKLVLVFDWLDGKGETLAQLTKYRGDLTSLNSATMSMISLSCTSRKLATIVEHP